MRLIFSKLGGFEVKPIQISPILLFINSKFQKKIYKSEKNTIKTRANSKRFGEEVI
jgi:hypothetical protein